MDKKYIYVVTRLCLEQGSLSVLRYLSSVFPSEGPVILVDQEGEEFKSEVLSNKIPGLSDFYQKNRVEVNDILYISQLSPQKYKIEHISKPHLVKDGDTSFKSSRQSQIIVLQENQYVRELIVKQPKQPEIRRPAKLDNSIWPNNPEISGGDDLEQATNTPSLIDSFEKLGYIVENKTEYLILRTKNSSNAYSVLIFINNVPEETLLERLKRLNHASFSAVWQVEKQEEVTKEILHIQKEVIDKLLRIKAIYPIDLSQMVDFWLAKDPNQFIKKIEKEAAETIKARMVFAKFINALEIYRSGELFSAKDLSKLIDETDSDGIVNKWLEILSGNPFFFFKPMQENLYSLERDINLSLSELSSYFSELSSQSKSPS